MYRGLFNLVKRTIPKISNTELVALRSGNTSIDREILCGKVELPKKYNWKKVWPDSKIDDLIQNNKFMLPYNKSVVNYAAKNRFFSFLIDQEYGGNKLSVNELSNVLTKISSVDPALGVIVMVPNSLGPAELIIKYGTKEQKEKYLPELAIGTKVPCFGLTGPFNGSDATGSIDSGQLIEQGKIQITLNKRYITLAPVANLMGIAFNFKNNASGKNGVTLALVERNHPGLIQDTHHNPLNAGFPNGTIKGTIIIDKSQIIGGEENIGEGWKMLMECLSAGRGVSLPATANASSKVASFGILNYIQLRKQFNMSLSKMEAIQEKVNNIIFHTWIIQAGVDMTNDILDSGKSPAVVSAIMKQQCTERGRIVLNEAMDIHAGGSICIGHSNFLEKFYRSAPIGITVEGSNTLTRSLIIFGQGLNKSHPHIFPILESILQDDLESFKKSFKSMLSHSISLYMKSFSIQINLNQQLLDFACLTNFVALQGGQLKKNQMLSGDMADIFGNLYMAIAVSRYEPCSNMLKNYIIDRLVNENQLKINKIIRNLGWERFLLGHLVKTIISKTYNDERSIFNEIINNPIILQEIRKNIITDGTILETMDNIHNCQEGTSEYNKQLNKIINVDEYENI